jgi:hypothetical protein
MCFVPFSPVFFVIILLDEEVRVLDHSNSCRVVEDFKLSIFFAKSKVTVRKCDVSLPSFGMHRLRYL